MRKCVDGHRFNPNDAFARCRDCGLMLGQWFGQVKTDAFKSASNPSGFFRDQCSPYVPPQPPFVTVADCGHCFEDVGERG